MKNIIDEAMERFKDGQPTVVTVEENRNARAAIEYAVRKTAELAACWHALERSDLRLALLKAAGLEEKP